MAPKLLDDDVMEKPAGKPARSRRSQAVTPLRERIYNDIFLKSTPRLEHVVENLVTALEFAVSPIVAVCGAGEVIANAIRKLIEARLSRGGDATVLDDVDIRKIAQVAMEVPLDVEDKDIRAMWSNLIFNSPDNDISHKLALSLKQLRPQDARLLMTLMALGYDKRNISLPELLAQLPLDFLDGAFPRLEELSLSLTILERQSIISTTNNIGAQIFSLSNSGDTNISSDPHGQRVTSFGAKLHQICSRAST